ncbi:MAG: enoyl-CoA hydratase/isomerase family protein, partial [Actinobacteria bacterium]|nr:enoyl-CoA hydratase/isomerase family protein [Actinomycetota bacterium]
CIGAGAEVAAGCDQRVGTAGARIRFPGSVFGIPIGAARLPLLIGVSHAKDLLMTSRTIAGEEAYRIGLLNRLVSPEELLTQAIEIAAVMAGNVGSVGQKRLIDEYSDATLRTLKENRGLEAWQKVAGLDGFQIRP